MHVYLQTTYYNVVINLETSTSNIEFFERHRMTVTESSESTHTTLQESGTDNMEVSKEPVSILIIFQFSNSNVKNKRIQMLKIDLI